MGGEQNIEAFEFGGERTDGVEQVDVDRDQVPLRGGVAAGVQPGVDVRFEAMLDVDSVREGLLHGGTVTLPAPVRDHQPKPFSKNWTIPHKSGCRGSNPGLPPLVEVGRPSQPEVLHTTAARPCCFKVGRKKRPRAMLEHGAAWVTSRAGWRGVDKSTLRPGYWSHAQDSRW